MLSWGVWEVGKTKVSCKEAGSAQYKAHRAPQTVIQTEMQEYAINWKMVRNKHHLHKWHWIARKNYHISKVVGLIFKVPAWSKYVSSVYRKH